MAKSTKNIKPKSKNADNLINYFWAHDFYYAEIKRRHAKKELPNLRENIETAKAYFSQKLHQEYDLKYIIVLGLLLQTQKDKLLIKKF